ncbi:MAG: hypothetical protein WCJ31_15110 [Planctomycetia bacterium]
MAVTYTLGKDATITGVTNANVRNVTVTIESAQVDKTARGATSRKYLAGMKDATVEIDMIDSPPTAGAVLVIAHANSGLSGSFVVTSVQRQEPLDDVVGFNVTCKMKIHPTVV